MQNNKLILVFSIAIFLFTSSAKAADKSCPKALSTNNKIDNITILNNAAIIYYENEYYRIPVGYYGGLSSINDLQEIKVRFNSEPIIQNKPFIISFWMPSLRFSQRKTNDFKEYHTCVEGRPPLMMPNQPEYLVQIFGRDLDINPKGELVTPEVMYKNSIISYGESAYTITEKYGLFQYEHKQFPDKYFNHFHNKPNSKIEILMNCTGISSSPNPYCDGKFYFPDRKLFLRIYFTSEELPNWQEIIDATIGLLDKWLIKDPEAIKQLNQLTTNKKIQ